jgi:tetratricopeptide (TPR) repeat protein
MKLLEIFKKKENRRPKNNKVEADEGEDFGEFVKRGKTALEANVQGLKFLQQHEYQAAKDCFVLAIDNGLENAETFKYCGFCCQKLQYYYEGLNFLNDSIKLDDSDWEAYYFRITSFNKMNDCRSELIDVLKVIELLNMKGSLSEDEKVILSNCTVNVNTLNNLIALDNEHRDIQNIWKKKLEDARNNATKKN